MRILHYLFWIRNNSITSVFFNEQSNQRYFEIKLIESEETLPFTDDFWKKWEEYSGKCHGDKIDFCMIYDQKPTVDERLLSVQCATNECIWSQAKIKEALMLLDIVEPTEVRSEAGGVLAKVGNFINARKEDIVSMTASYIRPDKEAKPVDIVTETSSPFAKHYQDQLRAYRKEYEK